MPLSPALTHALKVIGKDRYSLATIKNLFIFAGALPEWQSTMQFGGPQREEAMQQWITGVEENAPLELNRIAQNVIEQILDQTDLPAEYRKLLEKHARSGGLIVEAGQGPDQVAVPTQMEKLLDHIIRNFRRAERPLRNRRKGKPMFQITDEYDIQDLLHSQLRVWIRDIRAEEWSPSYAGKSSRIDFVLPEYKIAIEVKHVRSEQHSKTVGQELEIDIAHYIVHPSVDQLWIVVYDDLGHVANPRALRDLSGARTNKQDRLQVISYVVGNPHGAAVVNA
jgi:REase_DpnII-MboI